MFEFGAIQWFFLGVTVAGVVLVACMLLGACMVSGWWSRLEEKRESNRESDNGLHHNVPAGSHCGERH